MAANSAHAASSLSDFFFYPSEMSVYTISTRRHIPEEAFFIVTAVKMSNLTKLNLIVPCFW
jgi:hypothetical protein